MKLKSLSVNQIPLFLIVIVNSLVNTFSGNLWIPNVIGQDNFAKWRQLVTILAYAGLAHLGTADGLQYLWLNSKGVPRGRLSLKIILLTTILAFAVSLLYYFLVKKLEFSIVFLFIITALSVFFVNFVISNSSNLALKLFYFCQTTLYISSIAICIYFFGISDINLPIISQIVSLLVPFVFSIGIFAKKREFVSPSVTFSQLLFRYNGLHLYVFNLTTITIYSYDRILAVSLIAPYFQKQYFFLSLITSLTSTITLVLSNIIFSRNICFSLQVLWTARILTATGVVLILSISEINKLVSYILMLIYPTFEYGETQPFLAAALIIFYLNIFLLPVIRKNSAIKFVLTSIIFMPIGFFIASIFTKNSLALAYFYLLFLILLVIFNEAIYYLKLIRPPKF